ncbi:MAG: aldo/keto reductase [Balneolaceae bacterium]
MKLHPSGPEFSSLALGFWRLHEWEMSTTELIDYIDFALELGITTFDHADIYGSYGNEELFGKALKERPDLRGSMEIVSKCGICLTTDNRPQHQIQHYNTTPGYIRKAVDRSLQKLNTDYLDLLLIHRPDPMMNAAEIADIFSELVDVGKVKHVGVSNFTPSQFDLLQSKLNIPLVTNQVECSLLHLDPIYDGTFDQAQKMGWSPMLWSPFAGGQLFTGESERAIRVRTICDDLSIKYDVTPDKIALAWLFHLPSKPQAVVGTGKNERLQSAIESLDIEFDRQDWYQLLEASNGHPVP